MSLGRYNRRGSSAGPTLLLAAVGLTVGLALALLFALPKLQGSSPPDGAQAVSSLAPIQLVFNRPMNHASVEGALSLSPQVPGRLVWDGSSLSFIPSEPWPLGGTVIVVLSGGRSQRGLPLLGRHAWTFTVGQRRLAYLTGGEAANLWVLPLVDGSDPRLVTNEPMGLFDFDISPNGSQFIYAARRPDGGADLRAINADGTAAADLVACPDEACVSPAFSPDGQSVAYERHSLIPGLAGDLTFGAARVVVRSLTTGAEQVVSEGDGRFPRWNPAGRLSYLDTGRSAVAVQDLATGTVTYVPNASGEVGTWSPDSQYLVFPELFFPPEPADTTTPEAEGSDKFYSFLARVTVATNQLVNLSGDQLVDDGSPSFSPSGDWLAFGRRTVFQGQWTPGRQLWLMRADGSEARALTFDPLYNHSAFRWSPDSTTLAYMRFNVAEPAAPAEIWLADVATASTGTGQRRLVLGYLPEWLP